MTARIHAHRLMAVLRVAQRAGEVRNTPVMRRAIGLDPSHHGAKKLCCILRRSTDAGFFTVKYLATKRCVWHLTEKGLRAIREGTPTGVRNTTFNRCKDFFLTHSDEELTYADISTKFGITRKSAEYVVTRLVEMGIVRRVHAIRGVPQKLGEAA